MQFIHTEWHSENCNSHFFCIQLRHKTIKKHQRMVNNANFISFSTFAKKFDTFSLPCIFKTFLCFHCNIMHAMVGKIVQFWHEKLFFPLASIHLVLFAFLFNLDYAEGNISYQRHWVTVFGCIQNCWFDCVNGMHNVLGWNKKSTSFWLASWTHHSEIEWIT